MNKHYFIIGPGRSGTTFLWYLFKELGLDTGTEAEFFRKWNDAIDHGEKLTYPLILKGTAGLCLNFNKYLERTGLEVAHIFFCVRRLEPMIVSHMKMKRGKGAYKGLDDSALEARLRQELPSTVGSGLLVSLEYPSTQVEFPRSAEDSSYLYETLQKSLILDGISKEKFVEAWSKVRNPKLLRNG